ncbi:MAG: DUF4129 domain-containing protein [Chloroflexota bacterium]
MLNRAFTKIQFSIRTKPIVATCLLLGMLFWGATAVSAQQQSIDNFWVRLEELQQTLYTDPTSADLNQFANVLETESVYSLPDGRVVAIRPYSLIFFLRADEPDLEAIDDQIEALFSARLSWEAGNYSDADLAALQTILNDPDFDYAPPTPSPLQEYLRDLWLRINQFLNDLLPERVQGSGFFRSILNVVGIVGFVIVLGYAAHTLFNSFYSEASGLILEEDEVANLTSDSAFERAQAFSTEGDFRTAVRYLYLSALLLLEEQGLLRYDRSLTNREYLRSVAHKPEMVAILRSVIEVFDRVWYGFQPLAANEYNEYVKQVEQLKQLRAK